MNKLLLLRPPNRLLFPPLHIAATNNLNIHSNLLYFRIKTHQSNTSNLLQHLRGSTMSRSIMLLTTIMATDIVEETVIATLHIENQKSS